MNNDYHNTTPLPIWQAALAVLVGVYMGFMVMSILPKGPHTLAKGNPAMVKPVPVANAAPSTSTMPSLSMFPTLSEPMNVLLMGVDSNGPKAERFVGTRSDTMMIAHLDPYEHRVNLVSIPRDSRVTIARGMGTNKINSAHALGGPELAVQTVRENFGVPIDHYVVVDTHGLKKLCEIVGPVEVLVEKPMHYHDKTGHLFIDLEPGKQILDPLQTEAYVRFRHDAVGDLGRINRQQWFLRQVSHKLKEPQVLLKLPELFSLAHDYVETDMSVPEMAEVASFLKDIEPHQVATAMIPGESATISGGSYWLPDWQGASVTLSRMLNTGISNMQGVPGDAIAAPTDESTGALDQRPLRVALQYPKGAEEVASAFEKQLIKAGYRVRYKWHVPDSECQHEQIVENTVRADEQAVTDLRRSVPQLEHWPIVVSINRRSGIDFTMILSPAVVAESAAATNSQPAQTVPVTATVTNENLLAH